MKMIKVKRMPQTVQFDGKTYGPSEGPISIPEELAAALGLAPEDGGEVQEAEVGPGSSADDLRAAQTLNGQLQGNLDSLLSQLKPLAQEGETPDAVLSRLLDEHQDQAERLERGGKIWLKSEERAKTAETRVTELEGRQMLPTDARERLVALPKIGEALADSILTALQAK
ncbi:hypothetical protein K7W42_17965 [Deinococcus sp. HMF7604]|uniref:hypothetical protein n=1 Tax=Deinococcus betulae TaxID=2873312 RepID=UPI001CCBACA7|nr:hypothetical protein [Deinococcus betulae]MBZ9752731.1 hypothetical protein [Deinococcus betulae]